MDQQKPVLIIGAGIGGLALAQGLVGRGISCRIFERDDSLHCRPQGFRFRLHAVGEAGLRACLPPQRWEHFQALFPEEAAQTIQINSCAPKSTIPSNNGSISSSHETVRKVDRGIFRAFLASNITGLIHFGKRLQRFQLNDHSVRVHFWDGTSVEGLFLVGADGINSTVAKQLFPQRNLLQLPEGYIVGKTLLSTELRGLIHHDILKHGTIFSDDTDSVSKDVVVLVTDPVYMTEASKILMPDINDYLYWVLVSKFATLDETTRISGSEAKRSSLNATKHWDPSITCILRLQEESVTHASRILYHQIPTTIVRSSYGVTVLGDAAHAMSPASGLGSNYALRDAAALLGQFGEEGISASCVKEYERHMWASIETLGETDVQDI